MVKMPNFLLFVIIDDLPEVRLERRAAYQAAVDVGLGEQLRRAGRGYGAAVLDTDRRSGGFIVQLADAGADRRADLLSLLGGGYLAGADGPDGLVGDDGRLRLIRGHAQEGDLDLLTNPVNGDALLTLL